MLTREQLLDEAQKQKEALAVIGVWRNCLFALTSLLFVLTVWGFRQGGGAFIVGIVSAVLTALSFVALLLVNLSIRNGHRNVERMLESLKS